MKIGVLTSGGDSPGMNAAIRAVVRQGIFNGHQIIGFVEGFRGLVEKDYREMNSRSVSEIIDHGGTILRTSRFPEFEKLKNQKLSSQNLKELGVDALIVIGGNGSLQGAHCLHKLGVKCVGIPASIDNDVYGTDYCIGFATAVNTIVDVLSKLRDTASAHERVFIVEVMGRKSGAIALNAGLAGGADYICLPETPTTNPELINDIANLIMFRFEQGKTHTLIVMAEGAGSASTLSKIVSSATSHEVRYIVPGHIQRGGSPTASDRLLASRLGAEASILAASGVSNIMVGFNRNQVNAIPLEDTYTKQVSVDENLKRLSKILA